MIALAVRRKPAAAMLAAALVAAIALAAVSWPAVARAEEPSGDIVTVLQPGENLVGWIAAEAPVGDLFAVVPEIEAVWAWDARRSRWRVASPRAPESLHSLFTLTPGMGLLVQIGGDQPVEWARSAVPARGLVQLRPGPNLVAWSGPDDSEISWWSKGVGISLVSAGVPSGGESGWSLYDPEDAATAEAFPAINRGYALWVTSSRNINWLQPTGVLPKIEFLGGASQSFRDNARANLESVLEFYADNYATQADFAAFTVYLPKNTESLIDADLEFWADRWENTADAGWAHSGAIVARRSGALGFDQEHSLTTTLIHEYFHVLQQQFSELYGIPNWIVEGTATWMQWRHADVQRFNALAQLLGADQAARLARSRRASLESSQFPYKDGAVASELLAQHAGGDALIEFWRLPADDSRISWRETFLDVFQVDVDDFYSAFCRFRRTGSLPDLGGDTPRCLDDGVRIVSGTLVNDDGTAISGATIYVVPLYGGTVSFVPVPRVRTDSQGRFTTTRIADDVSLDGERVAEIGEPLAARIEISQLCVGWYAADGSLGPVAIAIPFDDGIADIRITVPSETCPRIGGTVVGPDGVGLSGASVALSGPRSGRSYTASDGSFAFVAVSRGGYQLAVELGDDCYISYEGGDEVTPFRSSWNNWTLDYLDGVRVVVPENACRWSVRGRLIDSDGDGVPGGQVGLLHERTRLARSNQTGSDGSFSFVVPLPGEYQLYMGCQPPLYPPSGSSDSRAYYHSSSGGATFDQSEAALLSLGAQDVSGLVLRLPDNACDDR